MLSTEERCFRLKIVAEPYTKGCEITGMQDITKCLTNAKKMTAKYKAVARPD